MCDAVYSEINFHITWHTKNSLPMITPRIEGRLYHYLTHRILETPEVRLHAIGGIETHIHMGLSAPPNLLISDYIGKLSHFLVRCGILGQREWKMVNGKYQPKTRHFRFLEKTLGQLGQWDRSVGSWQ